MDCRCQISFLPFCRLSMRLILRGLSPLSGAMSPVASTLLKASLQRQYFLLSCFKTLSVVRPGFEPAASVRQTGAYPIEDGGIIIHNAWYATCSTNCMETSCGPPRQGQHVTMTTPLCTASLMAVIRFVLESGILPLPYVTMTTPSIGGSKQPLIYKE